LSFITLEGLPATFLQKCGHLDTELGARGEEAASDTDAEVPPYAGPACDNTPADTNQTPNQQTPGGRTPTQSAGQASGTPATNTPGSAARSGARSGRQVNFEEEFANISLEDQSE